MSPSALYHRDSFAQGIAVIPGRERGGVVQLASAEESLAIWIQPSRNDVRRSKRVVLQAFESDAQWPTGKLVSHVRHKLGFPDLEPSPSSPKINLKSETFDANHSAVLAVRGTLATQLALAELGTRSVILPAAMDGDTGTIPAYIRFRLEDNHGAYMTENIQTRAAKVASGYVMASLEAIDQPWYLDADLLAEETGGLELNERARRALSEALDAYRRGLYLACASLLGVVSEAMWYEAAKRIIASGFQSKPLTKAIANTATADVIERVGQAIQQEGKGLPATTQSELVSHATLLRSLRNYGVHPAEEDSLLAKHFEEDTCGLLIVRMATYLRQLGDATGAMEEALRGTPSPGKPTTDAPG